MQSMLSYRIDRKYSVFLPGSWHNFFRYDFWRHIKFCYSFSNPNCLTSNQNVGTPSGNTQFIVTSNIDWNVNSDATWCTVTPSGTGNDTIVAVFTENTTVRPALHKSRLAETGVTSQVVTVTQAGIPVVLSVIPSNRNVSLSSGTTSFYVTSNTNWNVIS